MCGDRPCVKPDCTWSEQYRAACEARSVMRRLHPERQAYYAAVLHHRGQAGLAALIEKVREEWQRTQHEC